MEAGPLRHRVTIQQATAAQDAGGEAVLTYATWKTRWAAVEPMTARELMHAGQSQPYMEINHRVRMRYVTGIQPQDRIVHNARNLEIVSIINPDERNRETICLCKEVD